MIVDLIIYTVLLFAVVVVAITVFAMVQYNRNVRDDILSTSRMIEKEMEALKRSEKIMEDIKNNPEYIKKEINEK